MSPATGIDRAARRAWLHATDDQLAAACAVDRYRASGPGGQHRNKTESAVRVRHLATGLTAIGEDSRSQHENRLHALRRLRAKLALELRAPVEPARYTPGPALAAVIAGGTARLGEKTRLTPGYLEAMAELLDVLAACGGEVAATAAATGQTTGATSKLLLHDPQVGAAANRLRQAAGLRPLR